VNACIKPAALVASLALVGVGSAHGFGVAGHAVAGAVAQPRLCARSQEAVADFGRNRSLMELGDWADQIRYVPAWEHTAPWHYMNIPDNGSLADHRTPTEGDVLWAIDHFTERLGDGTLSFDDRANALRFLVHFIVDIHQPLHVGRAIDRGGNAISFRIDGERTNLHRLWDSGVVASERDSRSRYTVSVLALAVASESDWVAASPREWAAQSKALRGLVYDFTGTPDVRYLTTAERIVRERLAQAGVRLAATLNGVFCAGADQPGR